MGKAADGAALLAAAMKTAVSARAPRRTVQAIAAAVTAVALRCDGHKGVRRIDAPSINEEDLAPRLRRTHAARRKAKRQRREAAKAAAAMVPPIES